MEQHKMTFDTFMKESHDYTNGDTIAAVSTPPGSGGIAVIRVSGPDAIRIVNSAWKGKSLETVESHSAHFGKYISIDGRMLDECVATVYRGPATFTGENTVEIAVHGSRWIQREVLTDLINRKARAAEPGEFTRRAFLNGRIDLAQAEGIADLISASSKAAHALAVSQTSGRFSKSFENLREQLIEFASLLELELDFSEEDVEFADREKMLALSRAILSEVNNLKASYSMGMVIKEGVPVVIAGLPNAGKSSLLNLLLNDDKAIVSNIPGTTRDIIEDTLEIDGILFRLTDTAGLRESDDEVESIGISRARERVGKARILIWVIDITAPLAPQVHELERILSESEKLEVICLANKSDLSPENNPPSEYESENINSYISEEKQDNKEGSFFEAVSMVSKAGMQCVARTPDIKDRNTAMAKGALMDRIAESGTNTITSPKRETEIMRDGLEDKVKIDEVEARVDGCTASLRDALEDEIKIDEIISQGDGRLASLRDDLEDEVDVSHSATPVGIGEVLNERWKERVFQTISFSTKTGEGVEMLKESMIALAKGNHDPETEIIITNARHYESLARGSESLERAINGIENGLSGDFIAQDVRETLHHLGTITGSITTPTLLHSIFSRFCIGK